MKDLFDGVRSGGIQDRQGVPAKGGSLGAPGPVIADGILYVGSGYAGVNKGMPGNVLLAFSAE